MQLTGQAHITINATSAFQRRVDDITRRTVSAERTRFLAANKEVRDTELAGLLMALLMLRQQRAVAIAIEAGAEHLAELDAEEEAYHARARDLGAAWARPSPTSRFIG
jgi:hypothetical protein